MISTSSKTPLLPTLAQHHFFMGAFLLCFSYLCIQFFYIPYVTLTVDDFWLAYHTYQYKSAIPYHDFSPYKTVLGYYLLLIPMSLTHGILAPLFYTKAFIACINFVFLAGISLWLRKHFSPQAILISLALIVCTPFFLDHSAGIRVDLLAYWFCLISALFLLENKFFLAGISIGLGFAFCQKTLWYIIATDCALASYWLCLSRTLPTAKDALRFNLSAIFPILLYLFFWSGFSSVQTVLHSVFYEAYLVSHITDYNDGHAAYWFIILQNNPLLFMLWPAMWLTVITTPKQNPELKKRFFIAIYSTVILFFIATYKQPFAYNMLATIPAFFLAYTALFSWIQTVFQHDDDIPPMILTKKSILLGLLILYLAGLVTLHVKFLLPSAYVMIYLIPTLLVAYLIQKNASSSLRSSCLYVILLATLFSGIIYPLIRFAVNTESLNGHYQQYTLTLAHTLLDDGGDYLAGEPLFYNKEQPIPGLKHIVVPSLNYLYKPTTKLKTLMNLSSLYLTPDTTDQIIRSIQQAHIKLYINNNRLYMAPPKLISYLNSQYQHFWGSIYLYSPQVEAGHHSIQIKFSGKYRIVSKTDIELDGKNRIPYSLIFLAAGTHVSQTKTTYRLRLIPDNVPTFLDPRYWEDDLQKTVS